MAKPVRDHYDAPWKSALAQDFPWFVACFFHEQWTQIDWPRGWESCDKELGKIAFGDRPASLVADKLVKVYLHGADEPVLVHVEIQAQRDGSMAERIFEYNSQIFEHYQHPVTSLVLLADDDPGWRPDAFGRQLLGTEIGIRFAVSKLLDLAGYLEALLADPNPFALIAAAHILTQQTHGLPQLRLEEKLRLVRNVLARNWDRGRIIYVLRVIHTMMSLPEVLEDRVWEEIASMGRRRNVEFYSTFDEMLFHKGEKKGIIKGELLGLEKGRQEGAAQLLKRQLVARFGDLPAAVDDRLAQASFEQLAGWSEAVVGAGALEQVFDAKKTPRN